MILPRSAVPDSGQWFTSDSVQPIQNVLWLCDVTKWLTASLNFSHISDLFFFLSFRLQCRVYYVRVPYGLSNDRQPQSCYRARQYCQPFNRPATFQARLFVLSRERSSPNHTTIRTRTTRTGTHCSIKQHTGSMPIPRSAGFVYNLCVLNYVVFVLDYCGGRTIGCGQK